MAQIRGLPSCPSGGRVGVIDGIAVSVGATVGLIVAVESTGELVGWNVLAGVSVICIVPLPHDEIKIIRTIKNNTLLILIPPFLSRNN